MSKNYFKNFNKWKQSIFLLLILNIPQFCAAQVEFSKPNMGAYIIIEPSSDCLYVDTNSYCRSFDSNCPMLLTVKNNCQDSATYVISTQYEVQIAPGAEFTDENIPQKELEKWERKVYFKTTPASKVYINGLTVRYEYYLKLYQQQASTCNKIKNKEYGKCIDMPLSAFTHQSISDIEADYRVNYISTRRNLYVVWGIVILGVLALLSILFRYMKKYVRSRH